MTTDQPPLLVQTGASAKQGFYLKLGASAALRDDERTSLGAYVVVCDRDGLCSLHEVTGIHRPRGVRMVRFGPQVEWPQGGNELRDIERYRIDAKATR